MSDNKKIVRDAAIEALIKGTLQTELDGGGVNPTAMEPLIAAFASEVFIIVPIIYVNLATRTYCNMK